MTRMICMGAVIRPHKRNIGVIIKVDGIYNMGLISKALKEKNLYWEIVDRKRGQKSNSQKRFSVRLWSPQYSPLSS